MQNPLDYASNVLIYPVATMKARVQSVSRPNSFWRGASALALVALLLVAGFALWWPDGVDYFFTFRPVARGFLSGETRLYDEASLGFYNAPWTLLILVPFGLLSFSLGQAVLNTLSLGIIASTSFFLQAARRIPPLFVVLSMVNLHTVDVLFRGQVDALALLGVLLGWLGVRNHRPYALSWGLWFIAIKPNNLLLVVLVFALAVRRWPWRDWLRAVSIPAASFALSLLVVGLDWPLRYIENYRVHGPPRYLSVTTWRALDQAGLPAEPFWPVAALLVIAVLVFAYRAGLTEHTLILALTTNLLVSPYVVGNHLIYLVPAYLLIASRNRWLGVVIFLTTLTPLLRASGVPEWATADLLYPSALWLAGWFYARRDPGRTAGVPAGEPHSTPA
ncbi:MAG TPA: hypothetical protein PKD46_17705 [Aggregatilineaceae bacterium]|nr:hypothetical protein [Aggregatilineaceae bacterium]